MTKRKKTPSPKRTIWLVVIGLLALALVIKLLLQGNDLALFNPKGFIAAEQHRLMILVVVLLLELAIPTLAMFFYTAWKYRDTNDKADYNPDASRNKTVVFTIWALPIITMILLTIVMIPATHKLTPRKAIDSSAEPITIQVIAMRWKWLFIYPEQNIATVNFIQIPIDTPIQFELTADEIPMSSFWIPHLGGQLYAMTGHVNLLNLLADEAGDFAGSSAEINGDGFAGMKFTTRASSAADFNTWIQGIRQSSNVLDATEYQKLLVPSQSNPAAFYSKAGPDIYDTMLMKYTGSHDQHTEAE